MAKFFAVLNVIAWAGFWAFGYISLTSDVADAGQMTVAAVLACLGAGVGVFAYMKLVRHSEATGYSQAPKRAYPENETDEETA